MRISELTYDIETEVCVAEGPTYEATIRHKLTKLPITRRRFEWRLFDHDPNKAYEAAELWCRQWLGDYHDDAADHAYNQAREEGRIRRHDDYPEYPGHTDDPMGVD